MTQDDYPLNGLDEIAEFYGVCGKTLGREHPRYKENKSRLGDMAANSAIWKKLRPIGGDVWQGDRERIRRYRAMHYSLFGHS